MPGMLIRRNLVGALALAAAVAAGCSSEDTPSEPLPEAAQLIQDSAAATGDITSTHFTLQVNGTVAGLSVQSLDGDLTKEGEAKGTGSLTQAGQLVEVEFVLAGDTLYLKGPTGGYQEIPAALSASLYDPSAVLDPERGVAKLLTSMREPKTVAKEEVEGTETYKVSGTVAKDVLEGLLPGVQSGADVSFWLRADGQHLPVKASAAFADDATVDVTLSDVDKPVTVTPPA
ncbi:lipoprotein LprG [Prauserella marina]|uniref:Lipoprotein LprG n=2 Tax=Prauserella marina TaxID=530584 RepID=A0A1G6YSL6_9PSEU|nr:lipoprotein LprG [Prauserella marina]SDD93340.1 lipoprotein LprG [Prauserella marina]